MSQKLRVDSGALAQRLKDFLFEPQPEGPRKYIPFASSDNIKAIFDAVRNFALVVAVALGGLALLARSEAPLHPVVAATYCAVAYVMLGIAFLLFVLNAIFLQNVFEQLEFYGERSGSFRWALVLGFVLNALAFLVAGALWLGGAPHG